MARTVQKTENLFSLKVTLRGVRPPIWRRLMILGSMTLAGFHEAIQAAMGWEGSHLHTFEIGGRYYGDPDSVDDVINEEQLTMNTVVKSGGRRFNYTYDFGDNWQHEIVIEGKKPPVDGRGYPACIAGKRNCPPEDCGGRWGYQELVAVLADPEHQKYQNWIYGQILDRLPRRGLGEGDRLVDDAFAIRLDRCHPVVVDRVGVPQPGEHSHHRPAFFPLLDLDLVAV